MHTFGTYKYVYTLSRSVCLFSILQYIRTKYTKRYIYTYMFYVINVCIPSYRPNSIWGTLMYYVPRPSP